MSGKRNGTWISGWVRDRWQKYQAYKTQKEILHQATEQIVEVADPVIRQAKRYRNVLKNPIAGAMEYCTSIIGDIPGPFELSRNGSHTYPAVKCLFAFPNELEEVIRVSPEVNAFREKGYKGNVSALLTMAKQERTIFSYQQDGR
ncbi:MAG: hypothetical protein OEM01_13830 [Desulfobulbaceae bacterium]|nr:hypothetical protein [Desulfobulbaceae bacterium]